jgi:outer membrane protein assembly factor BamB/SAM-dependent methyltransferase
MPRAVSYYQVAPLLLFAALLTSAAPAAELALTSQQVVAETAAQGGLIIHLGCGDGRLTAALHAGDGCLVHGLDRRAENVEQARRHVRSLGLYGPVAIDRIEGKRLPYVDSLAKVVVADDPSIPIAEVLRVLAPEGTAYVKQAAGWNKMLKPRPKDIDDWTHYLHDASGNAVAADAQVGQPTQVRWIAPPYWSRSHEFNPSLNAAVSAGGRMFYTLDEGVIGVTDSPLFRIPDRWSLVARDAFSGVLLWKLPIANWGWREWNTVGMWSAPLTLQRRLVTDGRRVFFTLGYKAPITVLDAATGKTLRTLDETNGADEMVLLDGVLVACVRERLSVASAPTAAEKAKETKRTNPHEWPIGPPGDAAIMAIDTVSGRVLWKQKPQPVMVLTLAAGPALRSAPAAASASSGHVCFHDMTGIVGLDLKTGQKQWSAPCRSPKGSRHAGGTLVIHDDVVLFTGADGLTAFSIQTGEKLWTGPVVQGPGVTNPPDLFVADGLVWGGDEVGIATRERTEVVREGRDLKTGEVKRTVRVPFLFSPQHHVRCYRSKATDHYLLLTKRGVEFLDIQGEDHMRNDWLRAACSYGVLPCNGLLYVTPHHCFCYPGVKMNGFLALASARDQGTGDREQGTGDREQGAERPLEVERLQHGPAYSSNPQSPAVATDGLPNPSDWPTYRHDAARSGCAGDVPVKLVPTWQVDLGGRLTQPVVADGKVLVAQVDAHVIHALDASDGHKMWSYTAGGRIDSSPTFYGGLVLFGCRDGWVYCLRAKEGALVWRFRAAPEDRRIVAFDQIESPWPVPGSVLVQNGLAYVAAGRSSFLDGGIYLYGLEPATGRLVCQTRVEGPWPDPMKDTGRPFDMEGAKGDVLVGDGTSVYLYQMVFDGQLRQQEAPRLSTLGDRQVGLHLMSTGGLLDYEWYDRTYWTYARRWPGFYYADKGPKAGQILVFDDKTVYGLHVFTRRDRLSPVFTPATEGYTLFADDVDNEPILAANSIDKEKGPGFSRENPPKWSQKIPLRVRGMVLARDKLLMVGEPDIVPPHDPAGGFEGRLGGKLWVVSTASGEKLADYQLHTPTVFDGLSAAAGRLYLATTDGCIRCFSSDSR